MTELVLAVFDAASAAAQDLEVARIPSAVIRREVSDRNSKRRDNSSAGGRPSVIVAVHEMHALAVTGARSRSARRPQPAALTVLRVGYDARLRRHCRDSVSPSRDVGGSGAIRCVRVHRPSTTARTGGQTTAGRCARDSCICETATELSSAAWIVGQRNRFAGHLRLRGAATEH